MSTSEEHKKICLFGGSFDPIHLGHIQIAKAAVDELHLDKVIFLPCRQSPHKSDQAHASGQQRLEMCQLATSGMDWAEVDAHDLKAQPPCYSWRTAEAMAERYPNAQLFWLMGTDQWQALPRWNRPDHLASLVEFIVYTRETSPEPREGYRLQCIHGNHPASSTEIRQHMQDEPRTEWLPPQVNDYIKTHQLYRADKPNP